MGRNVHVVPHPEGWAVRIEGNDRASRVTDTQREAIDYGRDRARQEQAELNIHGRNGQIREKDSYGNDDCPPRG
jgi:hypothetical protein